MRCLYFGVAVGLALGLAAPAFAQKLQGEPYIAAHGGFNLRDDSSSQALTNGGVSNSIEYDTDLNASLSLGYELEDWPVRPAIELGYISSDVDRISANGAPLGPQFLRGDLEAFNLMANLFYDQELTDDIDGYLGVGLGGSYQEANFAGQTGTVNFSEDDDTVFAYQFMAGLAWHYTDRTIFDLGYRYWDSQDPDFSFGEIDGEPTHLFEIGVRYKF
jgi:opacity protein-like surface antigen